MAGWGLSAGAGAERQAHPEQGDQTVGRCWRWNVLHYSRCWGRSRASTRASTACRATSDLARVLVIFLLASPMLLLERLAENCCS